MKFSQILILCKCNCCSESSIQAEASLYPLVKIRKLWPFSRAFGHSAGGKLAFGISFIGFILDTNVVEIFNFCSRRKGPM